MISKKIGDGLMKDVSALGALPVYLFLIVLFFMLGYDQLSYWLFYGLIILYVFAVPIRYFYFKARPKKESYNNLIERIDASAFPSFHAWRVVMLFCFFNLYFVDANISVLFFIVAFLVSISRVYLKKHDVSDVLFGFVFGLISSLAVIWWM